MKEIPLTRDLIALVDDEDYEELSGFDWYADDLGYANRVLPFDPESGWYPRMPMHRQIAGICRSDKRQVDHIDRNPLNNQRSNLRICTVGQNALNRSILITNTSGFKGVSWHKKYKKWLAQIQIRNKKTVIGFYDSPEIAHVAYCVAAMELHGEFSNIEIKAVAAIADGFVPYIKRENSSGFKGVKFDKETRKWVARIMRDGVRKELGRFETPELAHEAYCNASDSHRASVRKMEEA